MVLWIAFVTLIYTGKSLLVYGRSAEVFRMTTFAPNSDAYTTCREGWYSFGNMCYRLGGRRRDTKLNFEKASEHCRKEFSGRLASVHSQEMLEFLIAYLMLHARETVWIGLHDRGNESVYQWDDGSPVDYTNWEPGEPSGPNDEKEDCAEMVIRSGRADGKSGQWNDVDCNAERIFICQREKGFASRTFLDARYCSPHGGFKFEESCFHLFSEKRTWESAENFCVENLKGHLATIRDQVVHGFVNYLLRGETEDVWIGIKLTNQVQQKWSSGWFVAYEDGWAADEEDFTEGSCSARDVEGRWRAAFCKRELPFVCEQSSVEPPVLKPAEEGSYCPKEPPSWRNPPGWRDLGGEYCYYIETKNSVSWPLANFYCNRRGGSLASIHSIEELNVLQNFVRYKHFAVYIGFYRPVLDEENWTWLDGSPSNFTRWDINEPNQLSEVCAEIRTGNMKWNDLNCDAARGYICSVRKLTPNKTVTVIEEQECFNGFSMSTIIGVMFCMSMVSILMGIVMYYFRLCDRYYEPLKKTSEASTMSEGRPTYRSSEMILKDDSCFDNFIYEGTSA